MFNVIPPVPEAPAVVPLPSIAIWVGAAFDIVIELLKIFATVEYPQVIPLDVPVLVPEILIMLLQIFFTDDPDGPPNFEISVTDVVPARFVNVI